MKKWIIMFLTLWLLTIPARGADIPDALRELVGADYIRRSTSYLYEDRWFICWDDRILDIYADWVLTDEQVAQLVQILKP
jgi:hypothetical protein